MDAVIQKWGNSLALRIPSLLAKDIRLHRGAAVDIEVADGKIVVNPQRRRRYALSRLLKGVTKSNRHGEESWGEPRGCELW